MLFSKRAKAKIEKANGTAKYFNGNFAVYAEEHSFFVWEDKVVKVIRVVKDTNDTDADDARRACLSGPRRCRRGYRRTCLQELPFFCTKEGGGNDQSDTRSDLGTLIYIEFGLSLSSITSGDIPLILNLLRVIDTSVTYLSPPGVSITRRMLKGDRSGGWVTEG